MSLGSNITNYRKTKQWSQEELGYRMGVSRQSISLWETDQTIPSLDNLKLLSELFDVSLDALILSVDDHQEVASPNLNYQTKYTRELHQKVIKDVWNFHQRHGWLIIYLAVIMIFLGLLVLEDSMTLRITYIIGLMLSSIGLPFVRKRAVRKIIDIAHERTEGNSNIYLFYDTHLVIEQNSPKKQGKSRFKYEDIEKVIVREKMIYIMMKTKDLYPFAIDDQEKSQLIDFLKTKTDRFQDQTPIKSIVVSNKLSSNRKFYIIFTILILLNFSTYLTIFVPTLRALEEFVSITHPRNTLDDVFYNMLWLPLPIISIGYMIFLKLKQYKSKLSLLMFVSIFASLYFITGYAVLTPITHLRQYDKNPTILAEFSEIIEQDIPESLHVLTFSFGFNMEENPEIFPFLTFTRALYEVTSNYQNLVAWIASNPHMMQTRPPQLRALLNDHFNNIEADGHLIYNVTLGEFNTVPENPGTYEMIYIYYQSEIQEIAIYHYYIRYI
jgi:transcriptional regulator with XRE-family HTH domain